MFTRYHFVILLSFIYYFHCTQKFEVNEIEESISCFYTVIGITGTGKSELLNALTGTTNLKTSCDGNSLTKEFKVAPLNYDNKILLGIDTPGLSDSINNDEKIKKLKAILISFPRIQKIIIVKKFNDVRIDKALQDAIIVFMESFPLKDFWDHVIVVNTWSDPGSNQFKRFMKEKYQSFRKKINGCDNLKKYMKKHKITFPKEIKEYFIDAVDYNEIEGMNETLNSIKSDISKSEKMFKNIKKSDIITKTEENNENKGFYIVTKSYKITFTDFNGEKIEKEHIFSIHEKAPSVANLKKTIELEEFTKYDDIRWYDVLSLSISWWIRETKIYRVYTQKIYEIGNKEIYGKKIYKTTIWK